MKDVTVIGLDIAKNSIQIHGSDTRGTPLLKKRIARDKFLKFMVQIPPCLVGMEACGGANYWAKELIKLGFEVKLMSPKKVKKFVENNKNDANDAKACSEAVMRADMSFVPIKSEMQLEIQGLHRIRSYYIKQRTGLINMTRGFLQEFGIVLSKGKKRFMKEMPLLLYSEETLLPPKVKNNLIVLFEDLKQLNKTVNHYTSQIEELAEKEEICIRLLTIKGLGPITATALVAKIGSGSEFRKGRELPAYLGLVPKQNSSGETQRLGRISKHGDRYIRQLLIHGGRSSIKAAQRKNKITGLFEQYDRHSVWIRNLVGRVGWNKASVAVANKNARIAVALLKNKTIFQSELAHG